jgi:hypothetical protein
MLGAKRGAGNILAFAAPKMKASLPSINICITSTEFKDTMSEPIQIDSETLSIAMKQDDDSEAVAEKQDLAKWANPLNPEFKARHPEYVQELRDLAAAFQSGIENIAVIIPPLQPTDDDGYRRYLFERGLLQEYLPPKYSQYLGNLQRSFQISRDPWIQHWLHRKFAPFEPALPVLNERLPMKSRKFLDDRNDTLAFGKRTLVLDFEEGKPNCFQPTVADVLTGNIVPKQVGAIRWIHLPGNNMSWVEVNSSLRCDGSADKYRC